MLGGSKNGKRGHGVCPTLLLLRTLDPKRSQSDAQDVPRPPKTGSPAQSLTKMAPRPSPRAPKSPKEHQKPRWAFSFLPWKNVHGAPKWTVFFLKRSLGRPKNAHGAVSVASGGHPNFRKSDRRGLLGQKMKRSGLKSTRRGLLGRKINKLK